MAQTAKPVQLKPRTLEAFDVCIHQAEMEMEQNLQSSGPFLWSDVNAKHAQQVREGKVWRNSGLPAGRSQYRMV
jgi:hypothetical protein